MSLLMIYVVPTEIRRVHVTTVACFYIFIKVILTLVSFGLLVLLLLGLSLFKATNQPEGKETSVSMHVKSKNQAITRNVVSQFG